MKKKRIFMGVLALMAFAAFSTTGCSKKKNKSTTSKNTTKGGQTVVTTKSGATTKNSQKKYTVTLKAQGQDNIVVPNVSGSYTLPAATTFTAPIDHEFECWKVNGESKNPGDVINVTANIEITAQFKLREETDEEKEIYEKFMTVLNNMDNYKGVYSMVRTASIQEPGETHSETSTTYYGMDPVNMKGYTIAEEDESITSETKYLPKVRDGIQSEYELIQYKHIGDDDDRYYAIDYNYFVNSKDINKFYETTRVFKEFEPYLKLYRSNKESLDKFINYMCQNGGMAENLAMNGLVSGLCYFTFNYEKIDGGYKVTIGTNMNFISEDGEDYPTASSNATLSYTFDDNMIYKVEVENNFSMAYNSSMIMEGFDSEVYEISYSFDNEKYNSITHNQTTVDTTINKLQQTFNFTYNGVEDVLYFPTVYGKTETISTINTYLHQYGKLKNLDKVNLTALALKEDLSDKATDEFTFPMSGTPIYCELTVDSGYSLIIANATFRYRDLIGLTELLTPEEIASIPDFEDFEHSAYLSQTAKSVETSVPNYDFYFGRKLTVKLDGEAYNQTKYTPTKSIHIFDIVVTRDNDEGGSEDYPLSYYAPITKTATKIIYNISGLTNTVKYVEIDLTKMPLTKDVIVYASSELVLEGNDLDSTKITLLSTSDYKVQYTYYANGTPKTVDSVSNIPANYNGSVTIKINMRGDSNVAAPYTYLVVE